MISNVASTPANWMRPSRYTRAISGFCLRRLDYRRARALARTFLTALEKLLLRARSRREFAAAADCARRILENDPWREDILRQLMSIRYESGRPHRGSARVRRVCGALEA